MGLTGVLTDVATRLHTAEAILPVVAAQREAGKDTMGWDRLPPTAHRVILMASPTTGSSILTSPPPTIHRFLNARNATALQADFSLTYAGNNIYLPTSFCQSLLQGHILSIPDPDAPTVLSPLLTPYIFRRNRKCPAAGNSNRIPLVHGTGSPIQRRLSYWIRGSKSSRQLKSCVTRRETS